MGLIFTLIYLFVTYIGPPVLFPNLLQYHIEVIIALLVFIFSIPGLQELENLDVTQCFGLFTMWLAVALSEVLGGWFGGVQVALGTIIPASVLFFFVILNVRKKRHLQAVVVVLMICSTYTIARGIQAERAGTIVDNPYVMTMVNQDLEKFDRIRGVDFLNDPNDLAQFLTALIALSFFLYRKGKTLRNVLVVYVPTAFFLVGMYLTHSRGGMLALMVMVIVAARRKIGLVPAAIGGGVLAVGLSAAGWAGGRSIGIESGADRIEAWGAGLEMIRAHPLFGVGYNRFTDFHEITAHNTVVVCTAEGGMIGLFCWMLVALPAVRNAFKGSQPFEKEKEVEDVSEAAAKAAEKDEAELPAAGLYAMRSAAAEPRVGQSSLLLSPAGPAAALTPEYSHAPVAEYAAEPAPAPRPYLFSGQQLGDADDPESPEELHRLSSIMFAAFAGFFAAGWLLSRPYTPNLFLLAGMTAAVYRLLLEKKAAPPPPSAVKTMRLAAITSVVLVMVVWVFMRIQNRFSH